MSLLSMTMIKRAAWFVLLLAVLSEPVHAADGKPFLHPLFTDNMVLQRGLRDPVWGWTQPGKVVTVKVGASTAEAVAAPDGKWMARIGPLPVGGPYTMTIDGPQHLTLKNVMVGDVWLCSGQSNMQFGIGNVNDGANEITAASHPKIRLFMVTNVASVDPVSTVPINASDGHWQECTPQTVAMGGWNGFSAAAYFFARDLQPEIHVPIGLIESCWGGTIAEAWTSAQGLNTMSDFKPSVESLHKTFDDYPQAIAAWYPAHDAGSADGLGWADPALDTSSWKTMSLPQYFQDAGDPDLAKANGVVWFRRTFDLPAGDAGRDAVLHFLADDSDTTWVNGTRVGATDGANVQRSYSVPAAILKPTGNVIAVRVLDTGGKGGIWGDPTSLSLEVPGATPLSLTGPWSYKLGTTLPANAPPPTSPAGNPNVVTVLYNGMIAPLVPFGIKGALWYQGEANSGRAVQYETLLPTLIKDWRTHFGEGNFPFLIVQLAGWQPGGEAWAELREAQMVTATKVPATGIATAIDIGDQNDIHPKNKQEVGRRLALVAEAKVYGQDVNYYGPVYKVMKVEGNKVTLTFFHAGGGLTAKDGKPLTAFTIAGPDGAFVPADAQIVGSTVEVSAASVPQPTAVRYGWDGYPQMSLYNGAGLPAFPFRTDPPAVIPDPVLPQNAGADLALGKTYVCSNPNTYNYSPGGLTDGDWSADGTHCFATNDQDAFPKTVTIDLGKPAHVGLVEIGVPPFGSTKTIAVSVSTDGQTFTEVGRYVFTQQRQERHLFTFAQHPAQFVRLTYPDHYVPTEQFVNTFSFTTECAVYAPSSKAS